MSILIKDLPEVIIKIAKERIESKGYDFNLNYELLASFRFHNTPEGFSIWDDVSCGKYELFYIYHKIDKKSIIEEYFEGDIEDDIIEIINKNYTEFKGTNEAELHSAQEIISKIKSDIKNILTNN